MSFSLHDVLRLSIFQGRLYSLGDTGTDLSGICWCPSTQKSGKRIILSVWLGFTCKHLEKGTTYWRIENFPAGKPLLLFLSEHAYFCNSKET